MANVSASALNKALDVLRAWCPQCESRQDMRFHQCWPGRQPTTELSALERGVAIHQKCGRASLGPNGCTAGC
jgi:hypothetical protein